MIGMFRVVPNGTPLLRQALGVRLTRWSSGSGPSGDPAGASSTSSAISNEIIAESTATTAVGPVIEISAAEAWRRRAKLATPTIQRDERPAPKGYYAPEWRQPQKREGEGHMYGTTPSKWEYYNKVVWPPGYIVPETGLPKAREVFHCRESVRYSRKRMWNACQLVRRMNVAMALDQLKFRQIKSTMILAEMVEEALKRARDEFHIPEPERRMFLAEAFPIQCKIIKGGKRHARDRMTVMRYRYIDIFIRLEEGPPPPYPGRAPEPTQWELMQKYYQYLRNRDVKYSI